MPKKTKHPRTAQRVRRSAAPGKDKKEQGSAGDGRPTTEPPKVIANSVFALTLQRKRFSDIVKGMPEAKASEQSSILYTDLLPCYNQAANLLKKDPFVPSDPAGHVVDHLIELVRAFKENFVPKDFSFNIDEHVRQGDRKKKIKFHFTVYDVCKFNDFWHFFEVRPIVEKLHREDRSLHNLFVILLKAFTEKTGISTWYNGGFGQAEFAIQNKGWEIDHYIKAKLYDQPAGAFEHRPSLQEAKQDLENLKQITKEYREGLPSAYSKLIMAAQLRQPESILYSLKKFSPNNRIVRLMKRICEFLMMPGRVPNYCYQYHESYEDEGLPFYDQSCLIWDLEDPVTKEQCEYIDSMANGVGVFKPTIYGICLPDSKDYDPQILIDGKKWPEELSKLFDSWHEVAEAIKPKKSTNEPAYRNIEQRIQARA